MAKYGMYPQPVYHATLDDGRTVRMTVWQKANALDKGFDWERCRRVALGQTDTTFYPGATLPERRARYLRSDINARINGPTAAERWHNAARVRQGLSATQLPGYVIAFRMNGHALYEPPTLGQSGRRIIAAHLEQSGQVLADDPLQAPAPKKAKRPSMAKWYEAAMPLFHKAHALAQRAGDTDLAERLRTICNGTADAWNAAAAGGDD